ncbi:chromosome condensation regulator RCC1 [Mobiluncus holmesii]|uniref:Chromosome condensation regulator RCC1 n=1 Tax=Mobiluncus porci TaxID=2652278 RepID=A0A7K0K3J5_9ACTO|nr:chromosome condensation regulator RCC1 [Mobiluncus porci]
MKIRILTTVATLTCLALPAFSVPAWTDITTSRIASKDRVETAVKISQEAFPAGAKSVYLARQDVLADALASGSLSDGPTLLVPKKGPLPSSVSSEIGRLNPVEVVALGGKNAVPDAVLNAAGQGRITGRLQGNNRFETAVAITQRAYPEGTERIAIADGYGSNNLGSPDAVAAGTMPETAFLLIPRQDGQTSRIVKGEISRLTGAVYRLGGDKTFNHFQRSNFTSQTVLQGSDRYATAVEIAKHSFSNPNKVYLARGDTFADAVAAGSFSDGPVLLVDHTNAVPAPVAEYLKQTKPQSIVALGGEKAVSPSVLSNASLLANGQEQYVPADQIPGSTGNRQNFQLRSISAGGDHTCAVSDGGRVYCWGSNRFGQIGNGEAWPNYGYDLNQDPLPENYNHFTGNNSNVKTPYLIPNLDKVVDVSAGLSHNCAFNTDGYLFCWGANASGQMGVGDTFSRIVPTLVPNLTKVTSVAAGGETNGPWSIRKDLADWIPTGTGHTCAVADGSVLCWGDNKWGQLGDGTKVSSLTPVPVQGIDKPATKVVVGETFSCALTVTGNVFCWGTFRHDWGLPTNNEVAKQGYPWLKDAAYADSLTARLVTSVARATDVEAGDYYACAHSGTDMSCWGYNSREQFFEDINPATMYPTGPAYPVHRHASSYIAKGWENIQAFSVGRNSSCAVGPNRHAYCWGLNDTGQVGRKQTAADTDDSSVRIGIVDSVGTTVKDISVGWAHTCVVTSDGGARCWGYNPDGQLGNGQAFGARCTAWQVPRLGTLEYIPRDPKIDDCVS